MELYIWAIIAVVYVVSVLLWYRYVKIAFSKNGIFDQQTPESLEFVIMLCPLVNTLFCFYGWILDPPRGRRTFWSRFFNIYK